MTKRIFKKIANPVCPALMAITLMAGMLSPVAADENTTGKWKCDRTINSNITTEGIGVEVAESGSYWDGYVYNIDYTIPEEFNGNAIHFDIVGDLENYYKEKYGKDITYLPGDNEKFKVTVTNQSGIEYTYADNSFTVGTANRYIAGEDDKVFANGNKEGYIEGATTFDGYNIDYTSCVWRTSNSALKSLLNTTSSSSKYYKDDKIDAALKDKGYSGLEELNKYYLDYMNNRYNKENTKLEQFEVNEIVNSIFNGYIISSIREINPEIATLGYDLFYNNLFMLGYGDTEILNNMSGMEKEYILNGTYSIGSWMRGDTDVEDILGKNLESVVNNGEKYELADATLYFSGPYMTNPYQSTSWGFELYVDLVAKTSYKVVHEYYTDLDGAGYALDGSFTTDSVEVTAGDTIYSADLEKISEYNGESYEFDKDDIVESIVAEAQADKNVITFKYYRTVITEPETTTPENPTEPETTIPETPSRDPEVEADTEIIETETEIETETNRPSRTPEVEADSELGDSISVVAVLIVLLATTVVIYISIRKKHIREN